MRIQKNHLKNHLEKEKKINWKKNHPKNHLKKIILKNHPRTGNIPNETKFFIWDRKNIPFEIHSQTQQKKIKCFSLEILFSTADSSQQLHIESADSRRQQQRFQCNIIRTKNNGRYLEKRPIGTLYTFVKHDFQFNH